MKKISTSTVKTFLKEKKQEDRIVVDYPVGSSQFNVELRTSLTVVERSVFINRVLSGCFDSNEDYRPEYVLPMFRATILQMLTNVPVVTLKGEQDNDGGGLMDLEAMNELYVALNFDGIEDKRYEELVCDLLNDVHSSIKWRKDKILTKGKDLNADAVSALCDAALAVRNAANTVNDLVGGLDADRLFQYAEYLSSATKFMEDGGIDNVVALHASEDNE